MSATARPPPPPQLTVLIVDDDAEQRVLVARLLADHEITHVFEAANGSEAIALASRHQPHVVLLDLAMPGASGFDVLPDIQLAAPLAAIVILSNFPQRRLAQTMRQRGAVGYVEKRTAPDRLITEILVAAAVTDVARAGMSIDLPEDSSAPRTGRRLVRNLLTNRHQGLVGDVELLVSELVTNAVVHASSAPQLEVRLTDQTVHVAVHDDDPALPQVRAIDDTRPGGRGIRLLETISARWGTRPADGGKVVWFEIDRREDHSAVSPEGARRPRQPG